MKEKLILSEEEVIEAAGIISEFILPKFGIALLCKNESRDKSVEKVFIDCNNHSIEISCFKETKFMIKNHYVLIKNHYVFAALIRHIYCSDCKTIKISRKRRKNLSLKDDFVRFIRTVSGMAYHIVKKGQ